MSNTSYEWLESCKERVIDEMWDLSPCEYEAYRELEEELKVIESLMDIIRADTYAIEKDKTS